MKAPASLAVFLLAAPAPAAQPPEKAAAIQWLRFDTEHRRVRLWPDQMLVYQVRLPR